MILCVMLKMLCQSKNLGLGYRLGCGKKITHMIDDNLMSKSLGIKQLYYDDNDKHVMINL